MNLSSKETGRVSTTKNSNNYLILIVLFLSSFQTSNLLQIKGKNWEGLYHTKDNLLLRCHFRLLY